MSLLLFGIQHIIYFTYIETLIPVWLPSPAFWTVLVTAALLLSAISFFSGWKIGLASLLLGICGVLLTLANRYLTGPTGRIALRHPELAGDILSD